MIKKSNFNKNNTCNNFCCTKIENFSVTLGNNEILKDVNGCEIEIKFNPLHSEKLYIFKEDEFYGIISK